MARYYVCFERPAVESVLIEVDADNDETAERLALETLEGDNGDLDFATTGTGEFTVTDCWNSDPRVYADEASDA
jgi:hypothetical protein